MKNIVYIVHNFKMGGIQKITRELARYQTSIGNKVSIICLQKGARLDVDINVDVYTLNLAKYLIKHPVKAVYYAFYKVILRYLIPLSEPVLSQCIFEPQVLQILNNIEDKAGDIDCIFVRGARSIKRTWWLNRKHVVYSLHLPFDIPNVTSGIRGAYNHWVLSKLFKDKKMFSVSKYIGLPFVEQLKKHNVTPQIFEVINNPCDLQRVLTLSENSVPEIPDKYIIGVGRLSKQKRFDILIQAFYLSSIDDYKLVILGEGNQREHLDKLVNSLNLSERVIFPGFVDNPYPWYKNAALFVLSSDTEGFVNVITEALACGTPVVSTNCGPADEILLGRLAEGIVPKGDAQALANKIALYIDKPVAPCREDVEFLSFEKIVGRQVSLAAQGEVI